jgi:hypothetical protein
MFFTRSSKHLSTAHETTSDDGLALIELKKVVLVTSGSWTVAVRAQKRSRGLAGQRLANQPHPGNRNCAAAGSTELLAAALTASYS